MAIILLTGANGQLGSEIREWQDAHPAANRLIATDVDTLDITDDVAVAALLKSEGVEVIVNCAAYTAVDKAEGEPDAARHINAEGPQVLAAAAREAGATLIHISTDYVFDGADPEPRRENDPVAPPGVYGTTKLEGEQAVRAEGCRGIILRTAWLYSSYGNNFVKTMMRLGREKGEVRVVDDQWGAPTYAADLAAFIMATAIPALRGKPRYGEVYHYSNLGSASWYLFAEQIMQLAGIECRVEPVSSAEFAAVAPRPQFSLLDKTKVMNDFGVRIPEWEDSLEKCMEKLLKA
ncbi:MAG: dTDP-4-dehydrorhamnose reductase [Rikenellaceae bacterium]|jgi:dTDP-4-dehydrorhamnose reductase|nr:dTDP-4-dehydrorhamnose reductase [Rikenellaceae bacterium]